MDNGMFRGYSDSDFAVYIDKRKSTSGAYFVFGGGSIAWRSKKQSVVAQSSVETEYITLSFAVGEALWLRNLDAVFMTVPTPILVGVDNQVALALAHDDINDERIKHIDVKYRFIREPISRETVSANYVPTTAMIADIMTKAVESTKHQRILRMMGM